MRFGVWGLGLTLVAGIAEAQAPPKLTINANPALMRISSAVAGSQPTQVSDATTTVRIRPGGGTTKRVTGQLSVPMPSGVTLTLAITAPPGATSLGAVTLDAFARDLIVNIPSGGNSLESMSYTLRAVVTAGVVAASSRVMTLTLLDYP